MSNLKISQRFDLIDNDTSQPGEIFSRYLDDLFTIDNLAFAEHITDIYPRELQLKKSEYFRQRNIFLRCEYQSYSQ